MANNLANRVADRRGASTEVAERPDNASLAVKIDRMAPEFQKAMPRGLEATQLVRDAQTVLRNVPDLAKCSPESVLGGLMSCAQLGLRVGVPALGHAWLLPLWNNRERQLEAQLILGYQGMIELAYRTDRIGTLHADVVYEGDEFVYTLGRNATLEHTPKLIGDRGKPIAYYAYFEMANAAKSFGALAWGIDRMEAHRDQFAMAKKKDGTIVGPWRDHFDSMAKKTMIRQIAKEMPKSTEFAIAMAADDSIRLQREGSTFNPTDIEQSRQVGPGSGYTVDAEPVDVTDAVEVPDAPTPEEQGTEGNGDGVAWPQPAEPGSGGRRTGGRS